MSIATQNNWKKFIEIFNSTGFIFILPAINYVITFAYETGKASYYHIPEDFIELQLPQLFKPTIKVLLMDGFFFILLIFLSCIVWLLFREIDARIIEPLFKNRLIDRSEEKRFIKWFVFVLILISLASSYSISKSQGKMDARKKSEYWQVTIDSKDYVVVDTYKDSYILVPIKGAKFETKYRFLKIEENSNNINLEKFSDGISELNDI
ncbi:hypothetical protein [Paenibacillus sp. MMS18-CY102]|uniref:hypothetical protein n=1 Tax=Paenibacillus sp. MMS18-CY102 TaxID=2682849 RepID=UPI0013663C9C|nr:hypothetical protein [Paenibacillus sp. MMS18-CY102]MWC31358.1 hypothetical protein [Paenibacillus sp. MMS18-CY102]